MTVVWIFLHLSPCALQLKRGACVSGDDVRESMQYVRESDTIIILIASCALCYKNRKHCRLLRAPHCSADPDRNSAVILLNTADIVVSVLDLLFLTAGIIRVSADV